MDMNRRGFLRGMLAAAAVTAMPTVAMQTPVVRYPHIVEALRLYDIFVVKMDAKDKPGMHEAMDDLFAHIYRTFKYDEKSKEVMSVVKEILSGKLNCMAEIRKIPPTIIETAWPVAMMKIILRDHAAPINHRQLKTFKEFHDKYGWYILEA